MPKPATGTVVERDGTWFARVRVPDGGRPLVPLKARTEAEARTEALAWQEKAKATGVLSAPLPVDRITVAGFFESWAAERDARGLTSVNSDRSRWAHHVPAWFKAKRLAHLTPADVERVVEHLNGKLAAGASKWTVKNAWLVLSGLLKAARRQTKVDALAGVEPPKAPRGSKALAALYPDDLARLLACPDVPRARRRIWAVLAYTGVRTGELEALRCGDLDARHGVLRVARGTDRYRKRPKATKGGKPRVVVLEPAIAPLLAAWAKGRSAEAPLIALPCHHDSLPPMLRRDLKAAGVRVAGSTATERAIRVHDLRAYAVSAWLARGEPMTVVRDRAGHASVTTTEGYWRPELGALQQPPGAWFPPLPSELTPTVQSLDRNGSKGSQEKWLRGQDLNLRPSGYEPDELPGCSTARQVGRNIVARPGMSSVLLILLRRPRAFGLLRARRSGSRWRGSWPGAGT
jgi:integrase